MIGNWRALGQAAALLSCLLLACRHPSPLQSKMARHQIGAEVSPETRADIQALYSDSPVERAQAARSLGGRAALGSDSLAAVPFLIQLLGDDAQVPFEVRQAGRKRSFFDVPLETGKTTTAQQAIDALTSIVGWSPHAKSAVGALAQAARADADPVIRRRATELLSTLAGNLWEASGSVAAMDPTYLTAVATLAHAIRSDPAAGNRRRAAEILGALGTSQVATRGNWGTTSPTVVSTAYRQVVEALLAGLGDADAEAQAAALTALQATTGQNLGSEPARWREWWANNHQP